MTVTQVQCPQSTLWDIREAPGHNVLNGGNRWLSVEAIARAWVARRSAEGLERSTLTYYQFIAERYIIPAFGHLKANQLTEAQVVQHWEHLKTTKSIHMGKSFVRHLKMILNYAVGADLISKNVIAKLKTSVRSRTRRRQRPAIPTSREAEKLLEVINAKPRLTKTGERDPKWISRARRRPLFHTLDETAMRPSEARGLPWSCFHPDKGYIEIAQRADRWNEIGDCKTAASYRKVPISTELIEVLKEWKAVCPKSKDDLVFPTATGRPISQGWIVKEFQDIQVKAGVVAPLLDPAGNPRLDARGKPRVQGRYKPYALRHLRASRWIESGLDLKRLQTQMGHASIQITFDVYGHLIDDGEEGEER